MKKYLVLLALSLGLSTSTAFASTIPATTEVAQSSHWVMWGMMYTSDYDEHPFVLKLNLQAPSLKATGTFYDEVTERTYKVRGSIDENKGHLMKLNVLNSKGQTVAVIKANAEIGPDVIWVGTYEEKVGRRKVYGLTMSDAVE